MYAFNSFFFSGFSRKFRYSQNLRLINKKERKKMWALERFFERKFSDKLENLGINNKDNLFIRKYDSNLLN